MTIRDFCSLSSGTPLGSHNDFCFSHAVLSVCHLRAEVAMHHILAGDIGFREGKRQGRSECVCDQGGSTSEDDT